ncbi:MarR family transcriptional regulator [Corynebacterium frankenforstense]|uniref:MarR family winged helix-turn-helix transcriptional regulator n=2 Tax=Corynebacterium frankenforstense TaxID=1230998 RepID=UPI002549D644|nr:MarR family transcriptional regulator [Corynebacterium frankenforstense]MDK6259991.1 MarR family transcriptional regulator [Corynebacterium frankenforstense]
MSEKRAADPLPPPAELLSSPSFQLERLRRRTRDEVESRLAAEDTTLREFWVLACLVEVGGDGENQSRLAATLLIDPSDVVRIIDRLEEKSWASRTRDPQDRRRQLVTATKKGRKAHGRLAELIAEGEDAALDESTSKQLKHLRKLARAIIVEDTPAQQA